MKASFLAVLIFLFFFPQQVFATISFSVSNPTISDNDEVELDASISGLTTNSCSTSGCYLQAQLRAKDESKNYFGFTYNSEEYIDYFSPSSTDEIQNKLFKFIPSNGLWSGKIKAKNNPEDSNYPGPGGYTIKLRRFSGNSKSSSGESNSLDINFKLAQVTPTPSPTSSTSNSSATESPSPTSSPNSSPSSLISSKSATVAANAKLPKLLAAATPVSKRIEQAVLGATKDSLFIYLVLGGAFFLLTAIFIFFRDKIRSLMPF